MTMIRVFPEEFGFYFTEKYFESLYDNTVGHFKAQFNKDDFLKEAEGFHKGTRRFELKAQNQLETGIKRYQWVDQETNKMIITAYNTGLEIIGIQFGTDESFDTDLVTTANRYHLPFAGKWFVLWGGADVFLNYHYLYPHQRYAYDFIQQHTGMTHDGERENLASYYAFGQPVTAPLEGTVVRVLTDVPDNPPHHMNREVPEGNAIIIQHENNEYSLLAHLRHRSVMVKTGDWVKEGEVIAQCGNSGASDTPHLHFHVMNGIEPHEADSIRINFIGMKEPVQGDTVQGETL